MNLYLRSVCLVVLLLTCTLVTQTAHAKQQPMTPQSDDEVLLVLPKSFLANRDKLASLRDQLNANPEDPDLAAQVASEYLTLGKRSGDPRFYGYARAALSRWWEARDAPPKILKIRADLKETDHQFDEAMVDLMIAFDAVLPDLKNAVSQESDDVQSRRNFAADLLLAIGNIYRVQGRYEEAMKIADQIQVIAGDIPATLCRAPIMAQTGRAHEAYDLLSEMLLQAKESFPSLIPYILTIRAEIADVLGRGEEVEQHFSEGLEKKPGSFYLLRGYGDYLLDHGKHDQALEVLREHTADTGVLLRAAIAAKQAGQTELSEEWADELETRFKEIRLRGGRPHGRYESRFLLALRQDPEKALDVALKNWQEKKAVRDTRNALEAAIAAGKPDAIKPIIEFLQTNENEHVILNRLVEQLDSIR